MQTGMRGRGAGQGADDVRTTSEHRNVASGRHASVIRASKFLRDLLGTGAAQILILLFSIILVRVLATVLNEQYLGVYMVCRRLISIAAPVVTLNLGIGLARYIAYRPEDEQDFLRASVWIVLVLSLAVTGATFALRDQFSQWFLGGVEYAPFIVLAAVLLLASNLVGITSDFYRGRQEMFSANKIQILFFAFPAMVVLLLWALYANAPGWVLALHLLTTAAWGIGLAVRFLPAHLLASLRPSAWRAGARTGIMEMIGYSAGRIPSGFCLMLMFGLPVFIASNQISLGAAARIGIVTSVIRLMEVWVYPFNLILLPKFAAVRRRNHVPEIQKYVGIVV